MLVLPVAENLDKLFENGGMAAVTPLGELGRVMVVAVDVAIVLVVAVLRAKDGGAERTGEVLHVVLAVERGDVGASKGATTLEAEEAQATEVVGLAEGVLAPAFLILGREEFGGDDLATVLWRKRNVSLKGVCGRGKRVDSCSTYLAFEAVEVECAVQRTHELASQGLATLMAYPYLAAGGSAPASRSVSFAALPGLAADAAGRRARGAIRGREGAVVV